MGARGAGMVDQGIARDLEQPGARLLQAAKALPLAQGAQEYFLQQVFCQVGRVQALAQEAAQFSFIPPPGAEHAVEGLRAVGGDIGGGVLCRHRFSVHRPRINHAID